MRRETLLSPGLLTNGIRLRDEACKAISSIEIVADKTPGGKTIAAATLEAFFLDCADKVTALADDTALDFDDMTGVATLSTQINITFPEAMTQSVTPAAAAFAVNNGGVVDSVAWTSATNLRLTGSGFAAADVVTYTVPATNWLRDLPGNAVLAGDIAVS